MGAERGRKAIDLLVRLAERDGNDPWMRMAVLTSAGKQSGELFAMMLANPKLRATSHGKALLSGLAGQIGAANQADSLAALVQRLDNLPAEETTFGKDLI